MNNKYICLDIETIPNLSLPDWVMEYVNKKIEKKHKGNRDPIRFCSVVPEMGQIICIVVSVSGEEFFVFKGTETEILRQFWDFMKDNIGYRVVGFNSKRFDIIYINKRSCILGIDNYNIDIPLYKYEKNSHYDLLDVLSNFGTAEIFDLETYCKLYQVPYENGINGSEIYKLYQSGNMDEIYKKCLNDVKSTCKLYEKVVSYL